MTNLKKFIEALMGVTEASEKDAETLRHEKAQREALLIGIWLRGCDGSCHDGGECNSRDQITFVTTGCVNVKEYHEKAMSLGMPETAVMMEVSPVLDGLKGVLDEYMDRPMSCEESEKFHKFLETDPMVQAVVDLEDPNVVKH